MGAGLSVGLSGLAAGFAVGIVGDAGVRGTAQQPRLVDEIFLCFVNIKIRENVLIQDLFIYSCWYLDYTLEWF